jgi:hypothetical protein
VSSKPTEQVTPGNEQVEKGLDKEEFPENEELQEQGLTPGAVLDHGRYRLLAHVGSDPRCNAELWRAKDGVLGRDVALTILVGDRADSQAATGARRTLERAMHASTFNHVGVARVLDVVTQSPGDPHGVLGVVIAEWTHGTDLLDLVAEGPLPPGTAARLLQPLAAAVEAAHHAGLVLGADHPQRIRVNSDGEIRMAFPGPLPHASSSDDVRGLGAALYLLLTGRWALSGGPDGVSSAPTGPDGTVVAPRTLRPTVPLELSTVAVRALGSPDTNGTTGGVRTGAAVLRVLEQHATFESSTAVMQPTPSGSQSRDNEVWRTEDPKPDEGKRKKLMVSLGVLAAATTVVLGWIIASLIGIFAGPTSSGPSVLLPPDPANHQPGHQPQSPASPVAVTGGTSFNLGSEPDNPNSVRKLYDGDPSTSWSTGGYNQQLGPGGISKGTGAILTLSAPTAVREVVINSASPGTKVEIHAVTGGKPDPTSTPAIGSATLTNGQTVIPVKSSEPTQQILVFLTNLTPNGGKFQSQMGEITVRG